MPWEDNLKEYIMDRLYDMLYRDGVRYSRMRDVDINSNVKIDDESTELIDQYKNTIERLNKSYNELSEKCNEYKKEIKRLSITNDRTLAVFNTKDEKYELFNLIEKWYKTNEKDSIITNIERFLEFGKLEILLEIPDDYGIRYAVLMLKYFDALSKIK